MYEFDCPEPVALSLRLAGGDADIIAEDRTDAVVDVQPSDGSEAARNAAERTRVELRDATLSVEVPEWTGKLFRRGPRVHVTVRLPAGGDLNVNVASADVNATGRFAAATVGSASGDIALEQVDGDASVKTASGDVRVGRVGGALQLQSASGDLTAEHVSGALTAKSASGDITVERAATSVTVGTASGDIRIGAASAGEVEASTASGDVTVGVVPGVGVWLDLTTFSGDTRTDLAMPAGGADDESAATLSIRVRSASGDIDVHRSYAGAAA